jgi:hypothetical protein
MNTLRDENKLGAWPIGVAAAVSLPAILLSAIPYH